MCVGTDAYSDIPEFKPYMASSAKCLRRLLLNSGVPLRCSECGISKWRGVPAPLQVDHIDGDRINNNLRNLRFLCPNCHALTPTFAGRNIKRRNPLTDDEVREAYRLAQETVGRNPLLAEVVRASGRQGVTTHMSRTRGMCARMGLELSSRDDVIFHQGKPSTGVWPADDELGRMCELSDVKSVATDLKVTISALKSRMVRKGIRVNGETGTPSTIHRITWPPDDHLVRMLERESRTVVARKLGVSDTAIKKRCMSRGIFDGSIRLRTGATAADKSRHDILKRERMEAELEYKHGTRRGYALELRLGLSTCDDCRKADRIR